MMKRIVATVFFVSLLLLAVALVAPNFINWNAQKSKIVAHIQPYFSQKIDVAGDVSFRILPNPQILLNDVSIANASGAKAPVFMKLKRIEASMKLEPLLQGVFEVDTVNLVQPQINLEVLKNGQANWRSVFAARAKAAGAGIAASADSVQFNQIAVTDGTLHYANDTTGTAIDIGNATLNISADTLLGPYRATGTMLYRDHVVNVDMGTGRYDGAGPMPVHVTFTPVEGLPQVKLNGVVDVQSGLDMQCDVDIQNGSLSSLFDSRFLEGLPFMRQTADFSATLDFKGGAARFSGIKARFGKIKNGAAAGGELSGDVTVALSSGARAGVTADVKGSYLNVSDKGGFTPVPQGFDVSLKFSGKHIAWNGIDMQGLVLNAASDKGEWDVKQARVDLPARSVVKLAGVVTPKSGYAAYSMQMTTDDFARFMAALQPAKGNILSAFASAPVVKKLSLNASVDVKSDEISIFDIDGTADDATKISGVLNAGRRDAARPSFTAHLNLTGLHLETLPQDAVNGLVNAVFASDATLDVNAKDFSAAGLKADTLSLKAKTSAAGLSVSALDAALAGGGTLHIDGTLATVNPVSGLNINYAIKTAKLGDVLQAANMDLPPLFAQGADADVKGALMGDAHAPHLTLAGRVGANDFLMDGTLHAFSDKPDTYDGSIHVANAQGDDAWASLGLPIDRLVGRAGAFDLSGTLDGSAKSFKVAGLKIKQGDAALSGDIAYDDGKYTGALDVVGIDVDNWIKDGWLVKQPMDVKLTGKTLRLGSYDIADPQMELQADSSTLKLNDVKGVLSGGAFAANISAEKQATGWKSVVSGTLKNADLQKLAAGLKIDEGASFSSGDIGFDLVAAGAAPEKTLEDLSGKVSVSGTQVTLKNFSLAGLPALIAETTGGTEFLADAIRKSLSGNGNSTYKNASATLKLAGGKIIIDQLDLANANGALKVKGSYDPKTRRYQLSAETQLPKPANMPVFSISRQGVIGSSADNIIDIKPIADYIAEHAPKPAPPVVPETAKTPTAVETHENSAPATPVTPAAANGVSDNTAPIEEEPLSAPALPSPTPSTQDKGIKGVLDRLNESP